jgi:hypothetical protein
MSRGAPIYEDSSGFSAPAFPHEPFRLTHRLADHPLLTVEALLELCRRLPAAQVEYNAGDLPEHINRNLVPMNGLSAEETVRRIAECRSWMALKNVEADPAYRELVDQVLDEVRSSTRRTLPGLDHRQGFIFLSSPGAVTPLHSDPEHNVLHQVRGSKIVRMWSPRDPDNITDEEMEGFFAGRDFRGFQPRARDRVEWEFELKPGDALHFPFMAPHMVRNGPEVSVSFSTTWQSDWARRKVSLHCFNARLRRRGLHPAPVGARPWADSLKYGTIRLVRGAKRLVGAKSDDAPHSRY